MTEQLASKLGIKKTQVTVFNTVENAVKSAQNCYDTTRTFKRVVLGGDGMVWVCSPKAASILRKAGYEIAY
jgi:hypothetical protein